MGGGGDRDAGTGRTAKASRTTPRRSTPRGPITPMRLTLLAVVAADRNTPAIRARQRAERTRARIARARTSTWRGAALRIPIRWCGSARSTCSETLPASQIWPLVSPLLVRSQSRRAHEGRRRCSPRFRPRASLPPTATRFERAAAEFIAAQRLNADRPEARTTLGSFYCPARPVRRCRGRIQGRAAAEPAISCRRRSISPISTGRLGRDAEGEERAARGNRRVAAGCRAASCARTYADPAQAAGRGAGRIAPRCRTRARTGAICLCLCRRAAFGRAAQARP